MKPDPEDLDTKCDMKERLSAYRDSELGAAEQGRVEQHLSICASCREELAAIESVIKRLKSLPAVDMTKDFSVDIDSIIARSKKAAAADTSKAVSIKKNPIAVWIAAAAAIALCLVVANLPRTAGSGARTVASWNAPATVSSNPIEQSARDSAVAAADQSKADERRAAAQQPVIAQRHAGTAGGRAASAQNQQSIKVAVQPRRAETASPLAPSRNARNPRRSAEFIDLDDLDDSEAILALSVLDDGADVLDATGISTDEDGLYAIKM